MLRRLTPIFALLAFGSAIAAEPTDLTMEEADSRLRHAYELARETNDSTVVDRVLELRDLVRRAFGRKDIAAAQLLVRDAEAAVGLEAGGKSMHGLPVGRIDPHLRKNADAIEEKLTAAMNATDEKAIVSIVTEFGKLIGENAGVPDVRRRGEAAKAMPLKPADVASTFVKLIEADPKAIKSLSAGNPNSDTLPRAYAAIVTGCLVIRPTIEEHFKDKLGVIDELVRGCCKAMMSLQLKSGHFKFPDVRGQNLVIGDAIEKLVEKNADAIQDGWVVAPFPDGMSQIDSAECGITLLHAGVFYKNADWTQAGLAAAAWSKDAPLVANFTHNAYSVSLLCAASKAKPEDKYRDVAWRKFRDGVASGQTTTGRLIDPRSARTANHLVFLRAAHDLLEVLPANADKDPVDRAARSAMKSVLDEADKLGAPVTALTVQELGRHHRLFKAPDTRVRTLLEESGTATIRRCTQGGRIRAAAPLPELAAVSRIWRE